MIERYETKEISQIWSDQNRFETFLKVELALLKSLETNHVIPKNVHTYFKQVKVSTKRIEEIEKETKHDVIAFCSSITEQVNTEFGKFFHFGVTSSDIIDTALSIQIKESINIIISNLEQLTQTLLKKATEFKYLPTMGRSHGMYAEPTSFGLKFLSSYCEFKRRLDEYKSYLSNDLTGQFSGAVGNYTLLSPKVEADALKELNLKVEPVSTQILPRDRIAKLIQLGSLTACALERLATEIRLLHHSDLGEVYEGFSKGQKGSSTMPHKKNPISSENICGLSRILKSHAHIAMENTNLWHERDISHSSAERMMLPDHFGLLTYTINRVTSVIDNLVINQEKVQSKLKNTTQFYSSFIMHQLILNNDISREDIYSKIQQLAFNYPSSDQFITEAQKLLTGFNVNINLKDIQSIYLKYIDDVFKRV